MNNLVSIITPSYNSERFINDCVESVIKQTYNNWELLIVDDASEDNSRKIIKELSKTDQRIKSVFLERNGGAAEARNLAIKKSKGRFLAFLDSDDIWCPNKLEKQIDFMIFNKYPFTYSFYSQMDEEGAFLQEVDNLPLKVTYKSSMKSNKIGCLTAIYDIEFFGKVYMENLRNRQDYTLWLKLLKKTEFAHCYPQILAHYRIRTNSISSSKLKLIKYHWEIYRHIEKQSFFQSMYYLFYYISTKILINR